MRKLRIGIAAALILAAFGPVVWPAFAQLGSNTLNLNSAAGGSSPTITAEGQDTNISITLKPKGTGSVSVGTSPISGGAGTFTTLSTSGLATLASASVTTGATATYFVRAVDHCRVDTPAATFLTTRLALGDWALTRTAAGAETYNISCNIPIPYSVTAAKGFRLDSFSLAHQITVAALTAATFSGTNQTAYVNNVANAVATYGGVTTITLPTATQANPYVTAATLSVPAFVSAAATSITIEYTVTMQNTGVYRVYGIGANFTLALY